MSEATDEGDQGAGGPRRILALESVMGAFADFVEEVYDLYSLTCHGISMMTAAGQLAEAVKKHKLRPVQEGYVEGARQLAALAEREMANDFVTSGAHAAVALWSALETTVPRILATYIVETPSVLKAETLAKVHLPVSSFGAALNETVALQILEQLERDANAPLKRGAGRFDVLVRAVGLSAPIDDGQRRDLYELSEVRNLTVHRFGIADDRFCAACPWIEIVRGDRIKVTDARLRAYHVAVIRYVLALHASIGGSQVNPPQTFTASASS